MLTQYFFFLCARDTNTQEIPTHKRDTSTSEIPTHKTRDTPSRLALLAHNFFFLSFLNKHYFYNQVTSVFIPWLGTRPGYKFELNFTLALS